MITNDIKALLGEDTISEETLLKIQEMIDTVVSTKLQEAKEEKEKEDKDDEDSKEDEIKSLKKELEEKDEKIAELEDDAKELSEKADDYVNHVKELLESKQQEAIDSAVASFIEENETLFEQLDQFTRMKEAFNTIQEAFEQNGFVLNENVKLDETKQELDLAVQSYDELFERFDGLNKDLEDTKIQLVFLEQTKDLTESQKEKVSQLAEGVSFDGVDEYSNVISLLIEQVSHTVKIEKEEGTSNKSVSPQMQKYLDSFK